MLLLLVCRWRLGLLLVGCCFVAVGLYWLIVALLLLVCAGGCKFTRSTPGGVGGFERKCFHLSCKTCKQNLRSLANKPPLKSNNERDVSTKAVYLS